MNSALSYAIELLRSEMTELTDEQRLAVFEAVTVGFCRGCGRWVGREICHCQNDE